MALTGGIQCIDNLALRLSLHGLEDSAYARKPTFCFSWSEPIDLDSVAGKLSGNPKRSHSLPTKLTAKISDGKDRRKEKRETQKQRGKIQSCGVMVRRCPSESVHTARNQAIRPVMKYANTTGSCKDFEEESSDEELCELMAERENIPFPKDFVLEKRRERDARDLEMCERKEPSRRKRYLEERDTFPINEAKRPRPRLDFDKVRLSRTRFIENNSAKIVVVGTIFAPIVASDSED